MIRALAIGVASLALAAAAPRAPLPLAPPLPLPPPLPVDPPTDSAAPVPSHDLRPPVGLTQGERTTWGPTVYRMDSLDTGGGYIPGSGYQSPEQRKPFQTPGILVTVPLQ